LQETEAECNLNFDIHNIPLYNAFYGRCYGYRHHFDGPIHTIPLYNPIEAMFDGYRISYWGLPDAIFVQSILWHICAYKKFVYLNSFGYAGRASG